MFFKRTKSKLRKTVFIIITVLIAIGLVIPLAALFQKQPTDGGAQGPGASQQTLQERLADLEAEAARSPENTAVLMELADMYIYGGKQEQAVKTYEQVLAVDPGCSDARYMMAYVHYSKDENDQAIDILQELIANDPGYAEAHLLYGFVLGHGKKDYAGGIQELEQFVAKVGEGPEVEKAKLIIEEWKTEQAQE